PTPDIATAKIEFTARGGIVSLTATVDDVTSISNVLPDSTKLFGQKKSVKLSYSSSRAAFAQLTIDGKTISLPTQPANPKRPLIEFEITKDNLNQIWSDGAVQATSSSTAFVTSSNISMSNPSDLANVSPKPKPTTPKP